MDKEYIIYRLKLLEEALINREALHLATVATETLEYLESLDV